MKNKICINSEKPKFLGGLNAIEFVEKLKTLDYAIFDFDGTVYPGLFLFDLTKEIFVGDKDINRRARKLKELHEVGSIYNCGDFKVAYARFVKLLKNEDKEDFQKKTKQMMAASYPYAKLVIGKLWKKYGIKSYLISLTSDFVADVAQVDFGFKDTFSIKYISKKSPFGERFIGKFKGKLENPQTIKKRLLLELRNLEKYKTRDKFICFFDSKDDINIASSAELKVGINPKLDLSGYTDFDLVLRNKTDPWKEFYNII